VILLRHHCGCGPSSSILREREREEERISEFVLARLTRREGAKKQGEVTSKGRRNFLFTRRKALRRRGRSSVYLQRTERYTKLRGKEW
jgi:hypothetical protein